MVEHIVDASNRRSRIDMRVGVGRRRRWSDEDKARIVAESYAPGAVASEVAPARDYAAASVCLAQGGASGPAGAACQPEPSRPNCSRSRWSLGSGSAVTERFSVDQLNNSAIRRSDAYNVLPDTTAALNPMALV
jgi:hypothetical protein